MKGFMHYQEGLLGTNFLQHHRVLIDFPAQQLLIRANEPG